MSKVSTRRTSTKPSLAAAKHDRAFKGAKRRFDSATSPESQLPHLERMADAMRGLVKQRHLDRRPKTPLPSTLDRRARNVLDGLGVTTVEDLSNLSEIELLERRGCGERMLYRFRACVADYGYTFRESRLSIWAGTQQRRPPWWPTRSIKKRD